MIFALWHGGANYAVGDMGDMGDVETFPSIDAASDALVERATNGVYRQDFTYADGRIESVTTPNADADPSMMAWLSDPREMVDPYPDHMITLGDFGRAIQWLT